MLKDSLYTIIAIEHIDNTIHAVLEIDGQNEIFNGHFPDHPVLPGACMVQIVKEIFEAEMGRSYQLQKADNLKFLSLVDPQKNNTLHLEIGYIKDECVTKVNASMVSDAEVVFKLQGAFIIIP